MTHRVLPPLAQLNGRWRGCCGGCDFFTDRDSYFGARDAVAQHVAALAEPDLFSTPDEAPGRTRRDDHATSRAGAESVRWRSGSQKQKLLVVYGAADPDGLTDEEAAGRAGLHKGSWWKRAGECRQAGVIEPTGETREGEAGVPRIVCRITNKGRELLRSIG